MCWLVFRHCLSRSRLIVRRMLVIPGQFTALGLYRVLDNGDRNMTKVSIGLTGNETIEAITNRLVSVISFLPGSGTAGHYVSYHKVEEGWFLNNDEVNCVLFFENS